MKYSSRVIALIIMLLPFFATAQVDLGIKVGGNFDKLNGNTWDNGYKASYLAGAFVGFRAGKMGVQGEFFFSQSTYTTGSSFYDAFGGFYNNVADSAKKGSFKVNYLNIPVLFQYRIVPLLWLQIGPHYSGVVSVTDKDALVKDAKELFTSGTVSAVLGAELKLPLHINIGARYLMGLSSLNATDVSGAWQNRTLQIHLGWAIF